ncbi:MAG: hypothetical protein LBU73_06680 [Helicobacteraceae bacterium]|jgi:hypothetical protein|nr:hypothetical protein [Helicobacteraceae bacterium]
MGLKKYFTLSIILLIALAVLIYLQDSETALKLTIGDQIYERIPLVAWAMAPAIVVFLVSLAHIAFYSAAAYFDKGSFDRDFKSLKRLAQNALLGQKSVIKMKTPSLAPIGKILSISQLKPLSEGERSGDPDLDAALAIVDKISRGETADFGVLTPAKDSPVWIAAQLNRMKTEPKACENLLPLGAAGGNVYFKALEIFATYGEKKRFIKPETALSAAAVLNLFSRVNAPQNALEFTPQEAILLCGRANFEAKDFLALAKILKTRLSPDEALEFFAQLKNSFDVARAAWLYVNIEFERRGEAMEILESADEDEFTQFRAYFALKDAGFNFKLDSLISWEF